MHSCGAWVYLILMIAVSAISFSLAAAEHPGRPTKIIVGAIRWDAWHGDASSVGLAVEKSLGPPHWHCRLPFFGAEVSPTEVRARGATQEVMDQEIAYAHAAGLDYWAFVTYPPDSAMSRGLSLYLSSKDKARINFCLNLQGGWVGAGAKAWPKEVERYVSYFREPTYQKVSGGRPLVYLFMPEQMIGDRRFRSWADAKAAFDELRKAALAAGLPTPYIVAQGWSPAEARKHIELLGLDAAGQYASSGGGKRAPYAQLAAYTQKLWDGYAGAGLNVVPLVTAGWDRRPRVENPVPWEKPGGSLDEYYETPAPQELAAHLHATLDWSAAHPQAAEAQAVLIYAWNEFDEGGWIAPTKSEGTKRLDAIGEVLRQR